MTYVIIRSSKIFITCCCFYHTPFQKYTSIHFCSLFIFLLRQHILLTLTLSLYLSFSLTMTLYLTLSLVDTFRTFVHQLFLSLLLALPFLYFFSYSISTLSLCYILLHAVTRTLHMRYNVTPTISYFCF